MFETPSIIVIMLHHNYTMPPMQLESHEHEFHQERTPGLSSVHDHSSFFNECIKQWWSLDQGRAIDDPFEPDSVDTSQTGSQSGALLAMLEDTTPILFHDNEESGRDPSPQVPASLASAINTSSKKTFRSR
jgi:hypothetical protein